MATTKIQPGSSQYVLAVSGTSNEFLLQNVSKTNTPIMIVWADAQPAAGTTGHYLYPGDAIGRNGITGQVYAIGVTGDAIIAVTEA